jgi:hypothetical protein
VNLILYLVCFNNFLTVLVLSPVLVNMAHFVASNSIMQF